jgi:HK97 family phage major capsid protein
MSKIILPAALRGSVAVPRALLGRVMAEASPAEILAQLNTAVGDLKTKMGSDFDGLQRTFKAFKDENDKTFKDKDVVLAEHVTRINAAIDEHRDSLKATQDEIGKIGKDIDKVTQKMAGLIAAGGSPAGGRKGRAQNEHVPAYAKMFDTYFRKGENSIAGGESALRDLEVKAALTFGSNTDGGYTVIPEIEQVIDETVLQISPMRQFATVMQIGTAEYRKLVNVHGTASGWVGETDNRPQTAGSQLKEEKFPVMEMYAMPAASQSLLDDSFIDIGAWLASEVQLEFARNEGNAFIAGNGVMKPRGFIGGYNAVADASYAWGSIGYIATGASGGFKTGDTPPDSSDCLIDAYHALLTAYRVNSSWMANRKTMGEIRKLKDSLGRYLMQPVLDQTQGFIEEVLGRPITEMPDMPDIGANSFSLAIGDWKRAYLIVDRVGIRVLRDPFTAKPFVLFYTTKRVGGGVQNFEALKLLKFATS